MFKKIGLYSATLCAILSIFIFSGCFNSETETFSISGKITYNNTPIVDAKVVSDIAGETNSLEDGSFSFTGLTSATVLTFSAEGYLFLQPKIVIYKEVSNLEVKAEKTYTLSGKVTSNNVAVAGARVDISGLVSLTVITNSQGSFEAEVAGEVTIKTTKDGFVFADKTANIDNPVVNISGTTDITANVIGVDGAVLKINDNTMLCEDGVYSAKNVALGSVIVPELDGYHFEPTSYTIKNENEVVTFNAYQLYNVSGNTKSGDICIENVTIILNGEEITTSDENGEFTLENLWGSNTIAYEHSIYSFNSVIVKAEQEVSANGTFTLMGTVRCGSTPLSDVRVFYGTKNLPTNAQGQFKFAGVSLGDIITFEKDGYKIDEYIVNNSSTASINAVEYYNAKITVTCDGESLSEANISYLNNNFTTDENGVVELYNCIEPLNVVVSKQGYTSENILINITNNQFNINLDKIYTIELNVHSGEILLNQAVVYVNNKEYSLDNNAHLSIQDCVKSIEVNVIAVGYNNLTLIANKNNTTLDFNLSYNVTGTVNNGDLDVVGKVIAKDLNKNQNTALIQNGKFSLVLYGENEISVDADNLIFDKANTVKTENLSFSAKYNIFGTLTSDNQPLTNAQVILVGKNGNKQVTTDEQGKYAFDNLAGMYTLMTSNSTGIILRPNEYVITKGGEYNFDASGYAISGKVLCGDDTLAGVKVKAGDAEAITNEQGEFQFDLIMGDVQVYAVKEGYTFNETYNITPDDNGKSFVFSATYKVEGKITCGSMIVQDVVVTIGDKTTTTDENGYFVINQLVGQNSISYSKAGFEFESLSIVDKYEYLNVSATFSISGLVTLGVNKLNNVSIINGTNQTTTNDLGEFTLTNIKIGDEISASKNGFKFNKITVIQFDQEFIFNGTYDINGTIKSAGVVISGVEISFLGQTTVSDSLGRFAFSNLQDFGEMTFNKEGYDFAPVNITEPVKDLEILASFAVSGRITIGEQGLAGVSVFVGEISTTTDEDGYYTLNGLSTKGWLSVEKLGYDFVGDLYFSGATTLNFTATYWVRFTVSSGDADMGRAVITTNATLESEGNNTFIIRGLVSRNTFTVNAETKGFEEREIIVTDYQDNMVIELNYSVILKLNSPLDGVKVTYSDNKGNYEVTFDAQGYARLQNLFGAGAWSVEKENYKFTPSSGTYSLSKTVDINYQVVYSLEGTVTSNGIAVYGMTMTFAGQSTTTNENGYYKLTNLVGSGTLKGVLSASNCNNVTVQKDNISSAGTYNFTVDNNVYAYWLFQKGYQNLKDNAYGYKIEMTYGDVDAGAGGKQNAYGIKIKDKNGVYLVENKNYGKTVFGISPRVSLTGYYDSVASDTNMQYKFIKPANDDYETITYADGKVNTDYSKTNFADITLSDFYGKYSFYPYGMYSYQIDLSTITSYSNITNNGDGTISFKFGLDPTNATINYKKQMKALSGQEANFKLLNITYTYDTKGNLLKTDIYEEYEVTMVVTVTIKGAMTESVTMFTAENADANIINKNNYGN